MKLSYYSGIRKADTPLIPTKLDDWFKLFYK